MNHSDIRDFLRFLADQAEAERRMAEIRGNFHASSVAAISKATLAIPADQILRVILQPMDGWEGLQHTDAGHGPGHWLRDYYNAQVLSNRIGMPRGDRLVGVVAGTVHDIACGPFVPRYGEADRILRHGEVGALYVDWVLARAGMSDNDRLPFAYAVAAHTHYLRPQVVRLDDGREVVIEPYLSLDKDGRPIMIVWLPRWVDRLDCSGASFVGRHFLTLLKAHPDFDGEKFYDVTFDRHLRPLLRTPEEIAADDGSKTMAEHLLQVFAASQNNSSPYGKHDFGAMIDLRDAQKHILENIVAAVMQPGGNDPTETDYQFVLAWLGHVEPSRVGHETAAKLMKRMRGIDPDSRRAWMRGLVLAAKEYQDWSREAAKFKTADGELLQTAKDLPAIGGFGQVLWF